MTLHFEVLNLEPRKKGRSMRKLIPIVFLSLFTLLFTPATFADNHGKANHSKTDATVTKIQKYLHSLGYNPGQIDGLYGPLTRGAILEYQRDAMLPMDGKASRNLLMYMQEDYDRYYFDGYRHGNRHWNDWHQNRYSGSKLLRKYKDHSSCWNHWVYEDSPLIRRYGSHKDWRGHNPHHYNCNHCDHHKCNYCEKKKTYKKKLKKKKSCDCNKKEDKTFYWYHDRKYHYHPYRYR